MNSLTESILQNTDHLWGKCNSDIVAEIAAKDLTGLFSPYAVHSVEFRERQELIGFEEVETKSTTRRKDGKSVTSGTRTQPIYAKKLEEYVRYLSPQEQLIRIKQLVMQLDLGEFFFKGEEEIKWIKLPLMTDMCCEDQARQVYATMRRSAPYAEPLDLRKHWIGSKEQKTETAAQSSGKPDMQRSSKKRRNTRS
jgi:hypothetical protein